MKDISSEVNKKAKAFRQEFRLTEISYNTLKTVFEKQGFTVIDFNPVCNDSDVSTIIRSLHLEDMVLHSKGFIYTDANYRLVFINEKLSEDEKALVLAHEQGHVYCGHTAGPAVVGRDVQEEYEANEFVHYLIRTPASSKIKHFLKKYNKWLITAMVAIILLITGSTAMKKYHDRKIYEGNYYVTVHGEKYHLRNCMTIEGHYVRRLTKKDIESGEYEPCSVCIPDGV